MNFSYSDFLIILNLIIIEGLLSVDNAAVLATMVLDLPKEQRPKALKYGLIGAYVFRGICLAFAYVLMSVYWIKFLGAFWLFYLVYEYFKGKSTPKDSTDDLTKENSWVYKNTIGKLGMFWSTVLSIELMDLAFSVDNVLAAVALSDKLWVICLGVFIGIAAMRFVAGAFVKLMEKNPVLQTSAFIAIALIGIKLLILGLAAYIPHVEKEFLGHHTEIIYSSIILSTFLFPLLFSKSKKDERPETSTGEI